MMKKCLIFGAIVLVFNFSLNSKSMMLGLDRMKEKVKKAADEPNKINFKEYLEQQKNGAAATSKLQNENDLMANIKALHWSKQTDLIKLLESKMYQKDEAILILKSEIDKKYIGVKSPFLKFISDVLSEKSLIEDLIMLAMKNMQSGVVNDSEKAANKDVFNQLIVLNASISRLIELVEKLLDL